MTRILTIDRLVKRLGHNSTFAYVQLCPQEMPDERRKLHPSKLSHIGAHEKHTFQHGPATSVPCMCQKPYPPMSGVTTLLPISDKPPSTTTKKLASCKPSNTNFLKQTSGLSKTVPHLLQHFFFFQGRIHSTWRFPGQGLKWSYARSEPHLQPTPQLMAMPDP